jgi:exopolyphosphatase/guanosine-5'-triphosphate,3'-diphosphate pyrophosphatase
MTDSKIVAAIDLGTNTLKLTVARCSADDIEELHNAANVLRLGKAIGPDGRIAAEAVNRVIDALIEFERHARESGAEAFIGAATQALRTSTNGAELMSRIDRETAWKVQVISGDEEARLTFEGLRASLPEDAAGMIVDIGGGSTELVFAQNRDLTGMESHLVGSGNLTDRLILHDPPTSTEIAEVRAEAYSVLSKSRLPTEESIEELLLAGGAGQFLDGLSQYLWSQPLSLTTIAGLESQLRRLTAEDVATAIDIPIERARVLAAGHQIARCAIEKFGPRSIVAVPSGIRTGLIAQWCVESSKNQGT